MEQHPLVNDSLGYGMIKKFRAWAQNNGAGNKNGTLDEEKKLL